ncbi:hypothetical protein L5515_015611 [Caenorhabditis briggsae]|uniref:Uncharacterized protein n=1 Tax=Caenorhabditis briggsae TaxID=6238 RepID=A0AAE9EFJ7_CAEBR|nr:hypothetical protein L5515_015611 [Caenorhabditis briggsae]
MLLEVLVIVRTDWLADTPEFKVLKGQHQEANQKLHAQRMMAPPSQQFQLEASINCKVRQFNIGHPNGEDYHDLHGMTTMGMVSYIQDNEDPLDE